MSGEERQHQQAVLEKKIFYGFAGSLVLLVLIGGLAGLSSFSYTRSLERISDLQERLTALVDTDRIISHIESQQRIYLITGERKDLLSGQAMLHHTAELNAALNHLKLHAGMHEQFITELEAHIRLRLDLLDQVMSLREKQGFEAARKLVQTGRGRAERAKIEAMLTHLETQQKMELHQLDADARNQAQWMTLAFAVLPIFTLLFLGFMFLQIRHEMHNRQAMEKALRDREARLHEAMDAAVDGIITIDRHGTVQSMNPAAVRLFGYATDEVIGRNISMLMPEPYHSEHDSYLKHYLSTGEKRVIGIGREVAGKRKNGEVFPIDIAVGETSASGGRIFIGTVRDITARKNAEQKQARLMNDLKATNEELINFSYVVSHDLKAPLRGIASLANWLIEDYGSKLDEEGNKHLQMLIGRVRRMDALIDGILEYSRVGRLHEKETEIDIATLVQRTIELLDIPQHITVAIETPLPRLVAEQTRIQQIFQNLIGNAVKYMDKPEGKIRIGAREQGREWNFYVCDNGPGIEERNFDKIFQLFQTLAPRDRVESTGVGLAIVKKIVEMYGGRIRVESERGQGSCFRFTLPKHPGPVMQHTELKDAHGKTYSAG